jgi:hypothetical protein
LVGVDRVGDGNQCDAAVTFVSCVDSFPAAGQLTTTGFAKASNVISFDCVKLKLRAHD